MSKRLSYADLPSARLSYDVDEYATRQAEHANFQELQISPDTELHRDIGSCDTYGYGAKVNPRISSIVEDESELLNLTRPVSKDPLQQFPFKQMPLKQITLTNCSKIPNLYDSTRVNVQENPLTVQIDRMAGASLGFNPQDPNRIDSNTRGGINTRLYSRDTYDLNNKNAK